MTEFFAMLPYANYQQVLLGFIDWSLQVPLHNPELRDRKCLSGLQQLCECSDQIVL